MAVKRTEKTRQWAAEAKKDPEYWAAANAAAKAVRQAIDNLERVAGRDVTARYLASLAAVMMAHQREIARRKTSAVPSITGRRPRNANNDDFWKGVLRAPPRGQDGKPMGISALARARALGWDRAGGSRVADASQGDAAKVDAARRHLTELKKEIRAEAAMLASLAGPPSAEE